MKILFANKRPPYPLIIGGDGPNIHTYFKFLAKQGHDCTWLGTSFNDGRYLLPGRLARLLLLYRQGYKMKLAFQILNSHLSWKLSFNKDYASHLIPAARFGDELRDRIQHEKPDVILTQLEGSDRVMHEAKYAGIPVVLFLTDAEAPSLARIPRDRSLQPSGIVCVSRFVATKIPDYVHSPIKIFPPPLLSEAYFTPHTGNYLTCVNPVWLKGGHILRKIIQQRPNDQFLIVKGWYDPLHDGLDFRHFPNVTLMNKQSDMRHVYEKTKILLVPSVWNEALPRVILEAGVSGIPSIASDRGGIAESLGDGGMLILKPNNIRAWMRAIDDLLNNPTHYDKASRKIKTHAQKFSIETIGPQFNVWLKKLVFSSSKKSHQRQTARLRNTKLR